MPVRLHYRREVIDGTGSIFPVRSLCAYESTALALSILSKTWRLCGIDYAPLGSRPPLPSFWAVYPFHTISCNLVLVLPQRHPIHLLRAAPRAGLVEPRDSREAGFLQSGEDTPGVPFRHRHVRSEVVCGDEQRSVCSQRSLHPADCGHAEAALR